MLYVPRASAIIATQIFVLNLIGWVGVLSNKFIIFWYPMIILSYYANFLQSIIFCVSSGDMFPFLGIYLSCSFITIFKLFCWCSGDFFDSISNFTANWVTSYFSHFLNYCSWSNWSKSVANCSALSRNFLLYLILKLLLIFLPIFWAIFFTKDKKP